MEYSGAAEVIKSERYIAAALKNTSWQHPKFTGLTMLKRGVKFYLHLKNSEHYFGP
jgi:hypothetical protein